MRLTPDLLKLAEEMKQWRPDTWRRWIDPATDEGRLSVMRSSGGAFYWYVETRDPIAKPGDYKPLLKLAEGRAATLEEAQAEADAAWISERGSDHRAREIAAIRERIQAEQARLAALTCEPEQTQEVAR